MDRLLVATVLELAAVILSLVSCALIFGTAVTLALGAVWCMVFAYRLTPTSRRPED